MNLRLSYIEELVADIALNDLLYSRSGRVLVYLRIDDI